MSKAFRTILAAVLAVSFCLALPATSSAQAAPQAQPAPQEDAKDAFIKAYKIGPGDLLEIKVFEVDQLNQTVRVSEDGSITLPLLQRVVVEGLTQEGIARRLTDLLQAKFVKNPQVTIFIKEYKSKQVAVIGAVEKPGSYQVVGNRNLLHIISEAGGFSENAANEIFILRVGPEGTRSIPIDLKALMVDGNAALNIPIEPNDVINVPVDREYRVFVMGRVTRPGAVKYKLSEGITLMQAIADAGGFAEGAKKSAIQITRKAKDGKEIKIRVNWKDLTKGRKKDPVLQEGDVVFVPESFW